MEINVLPGNCALMGATRPASGIFSSLMVFRPVPHRAVTAWGERVFCYGRAVFLSEQTECRSPVTEMPLPRNRKSAQPVP